MKLQNTRFERTLPGILKYQPTKVRKDRTKSLGIDTGKEYKNRGDSKPTQSAGQCCYDNWGLPVIRYTNHFVYVMTDKTVSREKGLSGGSRIRQDTGPCTLKTAYKERVTLQLISSNVTRLNRIFLNISSSRSIISLIKTSEVMLKNINNSKKTNPNN